MPNPLFGAYMGVNPYNLYNRNPYSTAAAYGNQPATALPSVTAMPQAPQSIVPQSNMIWVNGEEEITNYPTGRGWQQFFGDKNKNVIYVRETDLNGITQPIKKLTYTMEEPPKQEQPDPQPQPQENTVTREEFDKLTAAVNGMVDKLSELLK